MKVRARYFEAVCVQDWLLCFSGQLAQQRFFLTNFSLQEVYTKIAIAVLSEFFINGKKEFSQQLSAQTNSTRFIMHFFGSVFEKCLRSSNK